MMREVLNFSFLFKEKSSLLGGEGESKGAGGERGPFPAGARPSPVSAEPQAGCERPLPRVLVVCSAFQNHLGLHFQPVYSCLKVQTVSSPSSPGGYPVEAGTASRSSSQRSCPPKADSQEEAVDFCSWLIPSAWGEGSAWCWWWLLRVCGSS